MFLLRRDISDCITAFKRLARKVFSRYNKFGSSMFVRLLGLLSSVATDSLYGDKEMEECVKEAYGADTHIWNQDCGYYDGSVQRTTMHPLEL
jgi:hypothetical protein